MSGECFGRLAQLPLADLLEYLSVFRKTGVLVLSQGTVRKRLFVEGGSIVFASSNLPEDRLGDMLLRRGAVTRTQYDESVRRMRRSGRRQGHVLVDMGALGAAELWTAVREQVRHIVLSLFEWEEGDFFFEEGALPQNEIIKAGESYPEVVMEGFRALQRPGAVEALAPAPDAVLEPCSGAKPAAALLRGEERRVLHMLDGRRSVRELASHGGRGRLETLRVLGMLVAAGLARALPAPQPRTAVPVSPAAAPAPPDEQLLRDVETYNAEASSLYRTLLKETGPLAAVLLEKYRRETLKRQPEAAALFRSADMASDSAFSSERVGENARQAIGKGEFAGAEEALACARRFMDALLARQQAGLRRITGAEY